MKKCFDICPPQVPMPDRWYDHKFIQDISSWIMKPLNGKETFYKAHPELRPKATKLRVIDEDALEQANLNAFFDEQRWGIPDETRDAHDYEQIDSNFNGRI